MNTNACFAFQDGAMKHLHETAPYIKILSIYSTMKIIKEYGKNGTSMPQVMKNIFVMVSVAY
jgi:hypothetical protein